MTQMVTTNESKSISLELANKLIDVVIEKEIIGNNIWYCYCRLDWTF